ncbi:MAG: NTP transferase domain-containing protein [Planctomycetota bacterium]|nr:NTP transferase domain-containing protein [Planctomycetota bacterium]
MASGPGQLDAIILGAGKGTRMKSDLPKVVFPVGGRAMVCAVVNACREAGVGRIIVVVGHKQELVRAALDGYGVEFAEQREQLGTGHAVLSARGVYAGAGGDKTPERRDVPAGRAVLVLCGDGPLIRAATIRTLVARHAETGAAATLATAVLDDPTNYGRIIRDEGGRFMAIVEHKNCTPAQREVREVNPSYYCFESAALFGALERVERNALTGEYYLTDVPGLLRSEGGRVEVVASVPPEDVLSINTPEELARVDAIYRARATSAQAGRA